MKVIDLLNKIAKGEELPKKMKIKRWVYSTEYENLEYELFDRLLEEDVVLNDEVEIIEEDKKIEQLENYVDFANLTEDIKFDYLYDMISRLIDEVNKLKDESK